MTLIEPRQRLTETRRFPQKSQSRNNVYPEMREEHDTAPVKRYIKTALGMKTFLRRDPNRKERVIIDGYLKTATDADNNPIWRYDNEVIELYSDAEVRFFESSEGNAVSITNKSLVEYRDEDYVWSLDYNEDALSMPDLGPYSAIGNQVVPQKHTLQGHGHYMLIERQPTDNEAFSFGE